MRVELRLDGVVKPLPFGFAFDWTAALIGMVGLVLAFTNIGVADDPPVRNVAELADRMEKLTAGGTGPRLFRSHCTGRPDRMGQGIWHGRPGNVASGHA